MGNLVFHFAVPFLWGFVVLSGFIGWGIVVARAVGPAAPGGASGTVPETVPGGSPANAPPAPGDIPDWGLSAGWGMALVLAVGGVLSLAGLALPWVLYALVLTGAAVHWATVFRRPAFPDGVSGLTLALIGLAAVPLLTRYAGAVQFQAMSCGDDDVAYFTYVSRLLQTGTLIEPFSFRRLSGYGGQSFLQALVVAAGSEDNAYLLDRGIALIVSFGLVLGYFREQGKARAVHYLVALLLTVVLPFPLLNSSSHVTGLVMFLTLFRTLHRSPLSEGDPGGGRGDGPAPRQLWLIGLVAAGAVSLKAHYLVVASVTVLVYWLMHAVPHAVRGRGGHGRRWAWLGHLGLSSLVFLAPWMALLQRSSGTILYPLFKGNHRPEFVETYSGPVDPGALPGLLWDLFSSPNIALFCVPLVFYAFRRGPPAGLALYAGALVAVAVIGSTLIFDDLKTLHRYVAPFLIAAFVSSVMFFLADVRRRLPDRAGARPGFDVGDGLLCAFAVLLLPIPVYHDINRLADKFGATALLPEYRAAYQRMQSAIPEGARLLAVVEQPFALDYRRNVIFNVDVPGGASPDPGMPFFQGPGPLKDYLLANSIRYVAFRDFDNQGSCLYRRTHWEINATGANTMWRRQSKYYLDLMDNIVALAGTEKTVYRGDVLSVIDLR